MSIKTWFSINTENWGKPILWSELFEPMTPIENVQFAAGFKVGTSTVPNEYLKHFKNKDLLKRTYALRDLLVGRLFSIIYAVKHGSPLKGVCKYCPKIIIKDT